jgi:Helicase associated domain
LKWLDRQREQHKNEKLPASRITLLADLDFDFEINPDKRERQLENLAWKEGYSELLEYKEENGTISIPKKKEAQTEKQKRLSRWLAAQQVADQCKDLDPVRKALLVRLGVEFVDVSLAPPRSSLVKASTKDVAKAEESPKLKDSNEKASQNAEPSTESNGPPGVVQKESEQTSAGRKRRGAARSQSTEKKSKTNATKENIISD